MPRETPRSHRQSITEADSKAHLASGDAWQPRVLQFLRRAVHKRERCHDDAASERSESHRTAQNLGRHCGIENAEPGATEAFRYQQAREAELYQTFPQFGIEAAADLGMAAKCFDRHAIRQQTAQRIREQALLLAEGEFHQALAIFGSRGRSRPRSAMMFFWMLLEPPPIIRPTSYR